MKSRGAVDALNSAVVRCAETAGRMVSTNSGLSFRSRDHIRALNWHWRVGSVSHFGVAGDEPAMRSFFRQLNEDAKDQIRRIWATRNALRI